MSTNKKTVFNVTSLCVFSETVSQVQCEQFYGKGNELKVLLSILENLTL